MRKCLRCNTEMKEGYDVKVRGGAYGVIISKGKGVFSKRLKAPNVAICPKCGEISLYLDPKNID